METTTILDGSPSLAKRELLAPPPWFAALSDSEFSAQIDAAIDAARVPSERGEDRTGIVVEPDDDDELVSVPTSSQPVPVPRRQRKRSLATVLAAARKAGADRVVVDGTTIMLSPAAAVPEPTANEWEGEPA